MIHSVSGCTRGVQAKLWDPLRTCAILDRLRGVITTRRYRAYKFTFTFTFTFTLWKDSLSECTDLKMFWAYRPTSVSQAALSSRPLGARMGLGRLSRPASNLLSRSWPCLWIRRTAMRDAATACGRPSGRLLKAACDTDVRLDVHSLSWLLYQARRSCLLRTCAGNCS